MIEKGGEIRKKGVDCQQDTLLINRLDCLAALLQKDWDCPMLLQLMLDLFRSPFRQDPAFTYLVFLSLGTRDLVLQFLAMAVNETGSAFSKSGDQLLTFSHVGEQSKMIGVCGHLSRVHTLCDSPTRPGVPIGPPHKHHTTPVRQNLGRQKSRCKELTLLSASRRLTTERQDVLRTIEESEPDNIKRQSQQPSYATNKRKSEAAVLQTY